MLRGAQQSICLSLLWFPNVLKDVLSNVERVASSHYLRGF